MWNRRNIKRTDPACNILKRIGFPNLPLFSGVYCFNNGSGICKAFSGRFEFFFNPFDDRVIGPAPESEFVDNFGFHRRVPISYNISGSPLYADRSINWSRKWAKQTNEGGSTLNLLDMSTFNWCGFTVNDYWPYKSSLLDPTGRYHIYFFNRQSCIYDTATGIRTHYNTRFLHKSDLRIDLDPNPTIFVMEDLLNKKKMLVKHRRQHYFEQSFEVQPYKDGHFIEMKDLSDSTNYLLKRNRTILTPQAYRDFTDMCIHANYTQVSQIEAKNRILVDSECGVDGVEISDKPIVGGPGQQQLEVSLHGIPRFPTETQTMFRVDVTADSKWEGFAEDGLTYTAMTTFRPDSFDKKPGYRNVVRVIMIGAEYFKEPADPKYEHYPEPFWCEYNVMKIGPEHWAKIGEIDTNTFKLMNYPDDIAYLYMCKTILVIFGPLYQTLPADKFNPQTRVRVESIYELGAREPIHAFFADPAKGSDDLWFYHRTNWMTKVKYTCPKNPNEMVRAKSASKYYARQGANRPPLIHSSIGPLLLPQWSEEDFWKVVGVYKGPTDKPEAPDPANFPLGDLNPAEPAIESNNMWLYILIALAVLIVIAMCIICLITTRRWRKRRERQRLNSMASNRSGLSSMNTSLAPSVRSSRSTKTTKIGPSLRSIMTGLSIKPRSSARSSMSNQKTSGLSRSPSQRSNSLPRSSKGLTRSRRSTMTASRPSSSRASRSTTTSRGTPSRSSSNVKSFKRII